MKHFEGNPKWTKRPGRGRQFCVHRLFWSWVDKTAGWTKQSPAGVPVSAPDRPGEESLHKDLKDSTLPNIVPGTEGDVFVRAYALKHRDPKS